MNRSNDCDAPLVVIGAGPAGLSAAASAASLGLPVTLLDEQPQVGGQIYRGIERRNKAVDSALGEDYLRGRSLLDDLAKQRNVTVLNGAVVWQITPEREVYYSREEQASLIRAGSVIIATGAQERPMPFPGWTLPGVMAAGSAQALLKSSALVATGSTVLVGSGPLLYLIACQCLRAGGQIDAIVETAPRSNAYRAARHLPGALRAHEYLRYGVRLLREIRAHGIARYVCASDIRALGDRRVSSLEFKTERGDNERIPCSLLLAHNGVVPNVQMTRALGLTHDWDDLQRCWRPHTGTAGQTAIEGIYVAGDAGGITGARAAEHLGRIAALHIALSHRAITFADYSTRVSRERRALSHHVSVRAFLDALYAPSQEFLCPDDATIVCRCEEVTAGQIREFVKLGCLGPNQTKAFGRPGMGPCQGRLCGLTVSEIIARSRDVPIDDVGYYRVRPPIKPLTLGELASLANED